MAKRSRRERRQEPGRQKQYASPQTTSVEAPVTETAPRETQPPILTATQTSPANPRKAINFAQEYFYVYGELRNILIITVLMFAVMVGLSFII